MIEEDAKAQRFRKPRPLVFRVLPIEGLQDADLWFIRQTRGNRKPKYTSESYPKRVAVRIARRDAALTPIAIVKIWPDE